MQQDPALIRLRSCIEQQVNRTMKTPKDFDYLSECIFERAHQQISATTLKRLWGYLSEPVTPRVSTLNILAQFVGAESWEAFSLQTGNSQKSIVKGPQTSGFKLPTSASPYTWEIASGLLLLLLILLFFLFSPFPSKPGIITFADPTVKALCVEHWDTDGDGELSQDEAARVTNLAEVFNGNTDITSFNELQYFTGLTAIGESAFNRCSSLAFVTLPSSVAYIRNSAFMNTAMEKVTVPGTVKSIDWGAYAWNVSLKHIVFEEGVETVGDVQFYGCSNLEEIFLPSTLTGGLFQDFFSYGETTSSLI